MSRVKSWSEKVASLLPRGEKAQGTSEYAVVVGLILIVAIVVVTALSGAMQGLVSGATDAVKSAQSALSTPAATGSILFL